MIIELSPELEARVREWGREFNRPCEDLAVELLEEYFDDCDDADRLETLIRVGEMETVPASIVHAVY